MNTRTRAHRELITRTHRDTQRTKHTQREHTPSTTNTHAHRIDIGPVHISNPETTQLGTSHGVPTRRERLTQWTPCVRASRMDIIISYSKTHQTQEKIVEYRVKNRVSVFSCQNRVKFTHTHHAVDGIQPTPSSKDTRLTPQPLRLSQLNKTT